MKDANGKDVVEGQRAVLLKGDCIIPAGRIGTVRKIKPSTFKGEGEIARVSDGPEGDWNWSSWCSPKDFAVID